MDCRRAQRAVVGHLRVRLVLRYLGFHSYLRVVHHYRLEERYVYDNYDATQAAAYQGPTAFGRHTLDRRDEPGPTITSYTAAADRSYNWTA